MLVVPQSSSLIQLSKSNLNMSKNVKGGLMKNEFQMWNVLPPEDLRKLGAGEDQIQAVARLKR